MINFSQQDQYGDTVLTLAVRMRNFDAVEKLLRCEHPMSAAHRASIDSHSPNLSTPLQPPKKLNSSFFSQSFSKEVVPQPLIPVEVKSDTPPVNEVIEINKGNWWSLPTLIFNTRKSTPKVQGHEETRLKAAAPDSGSAQKNL